MPSTATLEHSTTAGTNPLASRHKAPHSAISALPGGYLRVRGASAAMSDLTMRPEGTEHQWRKMLPRELSVDLVAEEWSGRATDRLEAP